MSAADAAVSGAIAATQHLLAAFGVSGVRATAPPALPAPPQGYHGGPTGSPAWHAGATYAAQPSSAPAAGAGAASGFGIREASGGLSATRARIDDLRHRNKSEVDSIVADAAARYQASAADSVLQRRELADVTARSMAGRRGRANPASSLIDPASMLDGLTAGSVTELGLHRPAARGVTPGYRPNYSQMRYGGTRA